MRLPKFDPNGGLRANQICANFYRSALAMNTRIYKHTSKREKKAEKHFFSLFVSFLFEFKMKTFSTLAYNFPWIWRLSFINLCINMNRLLTNTHSQNHTHTHLQNIFFAFVNLYSNEMSLLKIARCYKQKNLK